MRCIWNAEEGEPCPGESRAGRPSARTMLRPRSTVYSSRMGKERAVSGMDFGIRVGAVVARGGALVLVRHQKPGRGAYRVLPGGRLGAGETISEDRKSRRLNSHHANTSYTAFWLLKKKDLLYRF